MTCNRNDKTIRKVDSNSFKIYLPFFSFEMSGFIASDSLPSWISMLELSLRGDLGLLGLRTLWKNDCTLPMQSCKKSYNIYLGKNGKKETERKTLYQSQE